MLRLPTAPGFLTAAACIWACSGAPEPRVPARTNEAARSRNGAATLVMEGEIGGLNEDRVAKVFKNASRDLERCFESGMRRHEFISGDLNFRLMINRDGEAVHAHMKHSTLGDRATEKCMLNALKRRAWPRPVGGRTGIAEYSVGFDPPEDVRPAVELPPSFAANVSESHEFRSAVNRCTEGTRGPYVATVYLGPGGSVLTASVTPPDEKGEQAVDCLVEVLRGVSFSSPGSWMGKVTFSL